MIRVSLVLLIATVATAQKKEPEKKKDTPRILHTVPLAVQPGTKQKLALRGKFLDVVKDVRVIGADGAKLKVLGGKKSPPGNNQPAERLGDTELEIELELPKDVKPGVALVAGDSEPFKLLLPETVPTSKELEPNEGFATSRPIPVPGAVDATIKSDRDVDVFRFEGKKGCGRLAGPGHRMDAAERRNVLSFRDRSARHGWSAIRVPADREVGSRAAPRDIFNCNDGPRTLDFSG